eukprot:scaffold48475_cov55-Phaeocystis_antarctica.AAC.1
MQGRSVCKVFGERSSIVDSPRPLSTTETQRQRQSQTEGPRTPPGSSTLLNAFEHVMCPGHYGCLHGNGRAGTLSVFE